MSIPQFGEQLQWASSRWVVDVIAILLDMKSNKQKAAPIFWCFLYMLVCFDINVYANISPKFIAFSVFYKSLILWSGKIVKMATSIVWWSKTPKGNFLTNIIPTTGKCLNHDKGIKDAQLGIRQGHLVLQLWNAQDFISPKLQGEITTKLSEWHILSLSLICHGTPQFVITPHFLMITNCYPTICNNAVFCNDE